MRPGQTGIDPQKLALTIDLSREMNCHVAVFERLDQLCFEVLFGTAENARVRVENGHHIPAQFLRAIKRKVRFFDQAFQAGVGRLRDGYSDRAAHLDLALAQIERPGEAGDDPIGKNCGLVGLFHDLNDNELVTAKARHRVRIPTGLANAISDCDQQFVAGKMPQVVVDDLEFIQVDHQHGDAYVAAPRSCKLDRKAVP